MGILALVSRISWGILKIEKLVLTHKWVVSTPFEPLLSIFVLYQFVELNIYIYIIYIIYIYIYIYFYFYLYSYLYIEHSWPSVGKIVGG